MAGAGVVNLAPQSARALEPGRTLSLYNTHTKENLTITYKVGGKFVDGALDKINWFMRDWRANKKTTMDPKLIDLVWELHRDLGSKKPVHLISGFRSSKTNAMLRRRGRKVARRSRHILGQAADVYFPDVPTKRLRELALVMQRGGVGFYPRSGKYGFVHVDTGNVRHWPRMAPKAYARLMKKKDVLLARRRSITSGQPLQIASLGNGQSGGAKTVPQPGRKPMQIARLQAPAPEQGLNIGDLIRREITLDLDGTKIKPAADVRPRAVANLVPENRMLLPGDFVTGSLGPVGADAAPGTRSRKGDRLDLKLVASIRQHASPAGYQPRSRRLIINRETKGNLMMTRSSRYANAAKPDKLGKGGP